MMGILIFWLIAGILLVVFSGVLYYYNTVGLIGFSGIFLLGIVVSLLNAYHLWDSKKEKMGKTVPDSLKNMFTITLIICVLMFAIGGLGYLLNEFEVIKIDQENKNNMIYFMIVGLVTTIASILTLIYIERNIPKLISKAIQKEQIQLEKMSGKSQDISREIKTREKDVKDSLKSAENISQKNKDHIRR